MRKSILLLVTGVMTLASCSRTDLYDPDLVNEELARSNTEKVFGRQFPNHDWCMTTSGELTVMANTDVKRVQLLVSVQEEGDDSPSYVTKTGIRVLTQAEINQQTTIKLYYDAPKDNLGLYVAFVTDDDYIVREVKGNTVSIDDAASGARTRGSYNYEPLLPKGTFTIAAEEPSYANERGWNPGEKLYQLSDYSGLCISTPGFTDDFAKVFRDVVLSYFPNGRGHNNLPQVINSGYYNSTVYPTSKGEPIVVTPIYKYDHPLQYGNEVYNSDLYYYYFKDTDPGYQANPKAYVESLPKYMAIPFSSCFGYSEDNNIANHGSYILPFYGDGTPTVGSTTATLVFPAGYQIGFMVRAKTTYEAPDKQGEVYADGRLNDHINSYGNFSSSGLSSDSPRAAWLNFCGKKLLCWESGTDSDFNDIILDVDGIDGIPNIPDPDEEVFTFCFEDRVDGDFDLNDVVIKAVRKSETLVEYSIVACGAYDELYIKNINWDRITDNVEVHSIFGYDPHTFINTNGYTCDPVVILKEVDKDFSLLDEATQPYIYNATMNTEVRLSKVGYDPHGIMIPNNFAYPTEKTCVKDAYLSFNNWAADEDFTKNPWYETPVQGRVIIR